MINNLPADRLTVRLLLGGLFLFVMISLILPSGSVTGWYAGYGIGFLAILLHFITSIFSDNWSDKQFFSFYTPFMFLRLLLVLAVFLMLLILEKFDQFSFTVSFLISYIYHSVINIILLNKELTNRSG